MRRLLHHHVATPTRRRHPQPHPLPRCPLPPTSSPRSHPTSPLLRHLIERMQRANRIHRPHDHALRGLKLGQNQKKNSEMVRDWVGAWFSRSKEAFRNEVPAGNCRQMILSERKLLQAKNEKRVDLSSQCQRKRRSLR
jgi:hypothetical protein